MSRRVSSLLSDHLGMWERIVLEHRERFGSVEGKVGGSVLETKVTVTVTVCVRGRHPQVILNRLNVDP